MERKRASGQLSGRRVACIENQGILYSCVRSQDNQICPAIRGVNFFTYFARSFVYETFLFFLAITEIGIVECMINRFVEHEVDVKTRSGS